MTNGISYRHLPLCLVACLALGSVAAAQAAASSPPERVRESAVCLDCHTGKDLTLAPTAHALNLGAGVSAMRVACTDCHGSNRQHWEDDPESNPMVNPSKLGSTAEAELCATCHESSHQQAMLEGNVHARNDVNCSSCHSVHAGKENTALLKAEEPALCYACHQDVEGQFARSFRHPVSDGVIRCSDCHQTLAGTPGELTRNGTDICTTCHAEFQGPFPFEHQATLAFSTEEGGCLACHAAHGSDNPRMLEQPYDPPHFQICSQCHSVPPGHNANPQHGTRWMGMACNDCHSDIHGSYTNRFFLNEALVAEGCLTASCHGH